jgi:tetratricopeptide (TPR) repeat protein
VAAQRQQTAIRDVLSQAQALYGSGSADAAIQLLHDSLAGAERALPPAPPAIQLQLVRELARMELAQGRSAAVLELLGRVEPLLAGQPELWAVRANAAQRLGRHQDAVQFYAVALQSRPAEQRWLMGSAVSLAALGQLSAAAEAAEKARSVAPVSKDVWAYLRQQGVALPERP